MAEHQQSRSAQRDDLRDPEPRHWLDSDDARAHKIELLKRSGLPLEVKVSGACRRFAALFGDSDLYTSTGRVVWGDPHGENAMRELDQCVGLYSELRASDQLGIQLDLEVLIECKHREDLEVFGIPAEDPHAESLLVVGGDLANASMVRDLAALPVDLSPAPPVCSLALIDSRANRVHTENLIYNAGASIFDFIRSSIAASEAADHSDELARSGVGPEFERFFAERPWALDGMTARKWAHDLPVDRLDAFNSVYYGGSPLYHLVSVRLPVVCVDAPLYQVELDPTGEITDFQPTDLLLTAIRAPGWPGAAKPRLAWSRPEVPLLVATPEGLDRVLVAVHAWFRAATDRFQSTPPTFARSAALETALVSHYVDKNAPRDGVLYRSDFDHGD